MRFVVVLVLAVLNAAFLLWQVYRPASTGPELPAPPPGVERLVLVEEVTAKGDTSDSAGESTPAPAADPPAGKPPDTPAAPAPEASPEQAPPAANPGTAESNPESADPAAGAAETQPTGVQPQPSEVAAAGPPPAPPDAGGGSPPSGAEHACMGIGPFPGAEAAKTGLRRLAAEGMNARLVERAASATHYWVYLPPFASHSEAVAEERKLREQGIRDIQVLAAEGKENGISLGLFSHRNTAKRRVDRIAELGYQPAVEEVKREITQYWIEFPAPVNASAVPGERWKTLSQQYPGITRQRRPCP